MPTHKLLLLPGDGIGVDDARRGDRQPGDTEALGGEAVARRQHALVLERGGDDAVAVVVACPCPWEGNDT